MSGFVGLVGGQLRVLVKVVVGNGVGGAIVLVGGAVKIIAAALGLQLYLRAGRTAHIRARIGCRHTKLFDGIEGCAQRALKRRAQRLIVVVDAIERQVRLIAASAVHRSSAA